MALKYKNQMRTYAKTWAPGLSRMAERVGEKGVSVILYRLSQ